MNVIFFEVFLTDVQAYRFGMLRTEREERLIFKLVTESDRTQRELKYR
jgi:hypothetical protein